MVLHVINCFSDYNIQKSSLFSKNIFTFLRRTHVNLKSETINQKIETGVELGTDVVTDNYSSYKKISSTVNHTAHKVDKTNANKVLPWVHKAISNAKRLLLDVHHRIDDDFLENYLNEFCYKFNRRYFQDEKMERLIIAGVNHQWNEL
jgi:hypothetical protein